MLRRQRVGRGTPEDVEALGIGLHQAILDTVVDHLRKTAGTVRATVDVAPFDARIPLFPSRRGRYITLSWRERIKNRIEMIDDRLIAANHQAIAAVEPPDATARAAIHVVNA